MCDRNKIFEIIRGVLCEILDLEEVEIMPEIYIIRDLDAESIDLLELGLVIGEKFEVEVNDDDIFLRRLRELIQEADENSIERAVFLSDKISHFEPDRIDEILLDLENGPVLKVKDLVEYICHHKQA
ncbi:phosphopantetheine-binding protein [Desulfobacterales bacterium HSG16]|nr:phosphopantetheine-binding protein [Desulfobacterales bacterium HSG16]